MHNKKSTRFNLLVGKNTASKGVIIDQAIIDLLIEKNVLTEEEIRTKIEEITREVEKRDPYRSSL